MSCGQTFMSVCVVVQGCPDGWLEFKGSCYLHFAERDTWSEAEQRCQELNAHLVSITSQEEQQFVNCESHAFWLVWTSVAKAFMLLNSLVVF